MEDSTYILACFKHPFFKSNWITDVNERKDAKRKLKYLLLDVSSPMTDKSSVSILEDFLNKDIKPLTS